MVLDTVGNNFGGEVRIVSANDVTLFDSNALTFGNGGTSAVSGNLILNVAAGAITDNGQALTVTGSTSLTATAAGNVVLDTVGNNFGGEVRIVSANDVTLFDSNALTFGNGGTSAVSGNLILNVAAGAITDNGQALTVTGSTSLTATAAGNVVLDTVGNNFGGQLRVVSANDVTLVDVNGLSFGNGGVSAISSDLSVTAAGAIGQFSAVTVGGVSSLTTTVGSVNLANPANDFTGALTVNSAGAVSLGDSNTLRIAVLSSGGLSSDSIQLSAADIRLQGNVSSLASNADHAYTASQRVVIETGVAAELDAGTGSITVNAPLYIDLPAVVTLTLRSSLQVNDSLIFYRGRLDTDANNIGISGDLVIFGASYDPNDPDRDTTHSGNIFYRYPAAASLNYYPAGGTYNAAAATFSTAANSQFTPLNGADFAVGGNFFLNGASMTAAANWTISVPANANSQPNGNPAAFSWGSPYAVALNGSISQSTASGGYINAAAIDVPEYNNGITDAGGNAQWQFYRPELMVAATVYDDVVRVEFVDNNTAAPMLIQNSNGEINAALALAAAAPINGGVWYNGGSRRFVQAYTTAECTIPLPNSDVSTFYIRTDQGIPAARWNTDADGSQPGDAGSSDRGRLGEPPANRSNTVDISFLKGVLFAADGKTMARNYGLNTALAYTATVDECRPVLVSAEVGQAALSVNNLNPPAYDAHNFIQLRWSEPVDLGGLTTNATDITVANQQSMAAFGVGQWGGALSGTTLSGYADFAAGSASLAARTGSVPAADDNGLTAAQVNGLYRAAPNAYSAHGLYVSVAGWSFTYNGGTEIRFWPGYFVASPTVPSGLATIPANAQLVDADGNAVEPTANAYGKAAIAVTELVPGVSWDTTAVQLAQTALGAPYFDVLPFATLNEIDKFELRFDESVRDSSFYYNNGTATLMPAGLPGFLFRDSNEAAWRFGATAFDTQTASPIFNPVMPYLTNEANDNLLSMTPVDPPNFNWTARSQMEFQYAQATGLVTDRAGNLLVSYAPNLCAERLPPKVRIAIGEVGSRNLYLQFTEPVWQSSAGNNTLLPSSFSLSAAGAPGISAVDIITPSGAVSEVWLRLDADLTTAFALDGRVSLADTIIDRGGTEAEPAVLRRAVDLASGAVSVLGLSDGIHTDSLNNPQPLGTSALGLLREFDGSGRLYDRDTTVFAAVDLSGSASSSLPLSLYYDVAPPVDTGLTLDITGRDPDLGLFWLPSFVSGVNQVPNEAARLQQPFFVSEPDGVSRNILIPAADPEIQSGAAVGFLMRLGELWVARGTVADDPTQFDLWRYGVQDLVRQRGGVTIANNVIDSNRGERTALNIDLAEAGQVTVLVFTLDGDMVVALHRGRLAAGSYTMTWNGTNGAGNPVARGMYFIRVVAPGIDEIRKVMVVRN